MQYVCVYVFTLNADTHITCISLIKNLGLALPSSYTKCRLSSLLRINNIH